MTKQFDGNTTLTETIIMDTSESNPLDQILRRVFGVQAINDSIESSWTSLLEASANRDLDSIKNSLCLTLFTLIECQDDITPTSSIALPPAESASTVNINEVKRSKDESRFDLIVAIYNRSITESLNVFLTDYCKDTLVQVQSCCVLAMCMFLDGVFSDPKDKPYLGSIFVSSLTNDTLPQSLMEHLIEAAYTDNQEIALNTILNSLSRSIQNASILSQDNNYLNAIDILVCILQHRVPNTKPPLRPACNILVNRSDFNLPISTAADSKILSATSGRAVVNLSYLGQILKLSLGDGMSHNLDKFFSSYDVNIVPKETLDMVFSNIQNRISQVRTRCHKIFKELLGNNQSREKTLSYIENVITANWKRAQIQVNSAEVADDGTFLNILYVLYELSQPISLDKVETSYIYYQGARARSAFVDETRMRMTPDERKEFEKQFQGKPTPSRFTTECFYLTLHAQHISIVSMLQNGKYLHQQISIAMKDLKKIEDELQNETDISKKQKLQTTFNHTKNRRDRLVRLAWSQTCQLTDQFLLHQTVQFCFKQLNMIISMIAPEYEPNSLNLPEIAPDKARALPEFYLEDVFNLLLHIVKSSPQLLVSLPNITDCIQAILVFVVNPQYFTNVFLAAKSIELLYFFSPSRQPAARTIWDFTINHPLAIERLFAALLKFYCRIETTGAHNEFFEKFDTRHHIHTIIMHLREVPIQRTRMTAEADKCDETFIQFVNMLINDTTFMLDESLDGLKQINEYERLSLAASWTDEQHEQERGRYQEQESRARGWLNSVVHTLDTFKHLTQDCPRPFLEPNLGERLAIMLNFNLQRLCGQSCQQLKVATPEKYGWKPKQLVEYLVDIYLNLSSEEFASYIAKDERSYNKEMMDVILARMEKHSLVPLPQIERIKDLFEQSYTYYKENLQENEQFEDAPDEFLDPIMGTLMKEPVLLPTSNKIMDRLVIERCLLTDPMDPFNRAPLTKDQLVPQSHMRQRIEQWKREKRLQQQ